MSSKAQFVCFFFFVEKYVPFSRNSSFTINNYPMIYTICDVTTRISTRDKVHFWIYLLNHISWSHQTWPTDRYKEGWEFSVIFWTICRIGARFQVLFNLVTYPSYWVTDSVKIPVFDFFEKLNKGQSKMVNINH